MFFEGNTDVTFASLREKKRFLDSGESHDHIRPLLVICGGIMLGVKAGGAVTALQESGFDIAFDNVATLSTGAPCGAYMMSGNPRAGTTIYSEECCTPNFINLKRWRNPVDTSFLDKVFRGFTGKALNPELVLRHRSRLYVAVTRKSDGRQEFRCPTTAEELFRAIHASINIPGLSTSDVLLDGELYVDGAYSNPFPLEQLVRMFDPTHVFVIANRTNQLNGRGTPETLLNETVLRSRIPPALRKVGRKRNNERARGFDWLRSQSAIPYVIMWSEGEVNKLTRDPKKLIQAAETAEQLWKDFL